MAKNVTKYNLTSKQAAEFLGVKEKTLRSWRVSGKEKIPFTKVGVRVRYAESDLAAYQESKRKTHT